MAAIRENCVSIAVLREIIGYDAQTGALVWLARKTTHFEQGKISREHAAAKWNSRYAGTAAFTAVEKAGYYHGDLLGQRYKAHRIAWALYYGFWPKGQIDHINGDPADNRIINLRTVSASQNMRNQKLSSANKSGVIGVCWAPHRDKWSAQIKVGGQKIHLGMFDNLSAAAAVRKQAEQRLNFHPNHGRVMA